MPSVSLEFIRPSRLDSYADGLWGVFSSHFEAERSYLFERLRQAQEIGLYLCEGRVVGCFALFVSRVRIEGRPRLLVCVGAVNLLEEYRGQGLVDRASMLSLLRIRLRHPFSPAYVWAHTSTFSSYLRFARLRCFYPRFDEPTPPFYQHMLDRIGEASFGASYESRTGTARVVQVSLATVPSASVHGPEQLPHIDYHTHQLTQAREADAGPGAHGLLVITPASLRNQWSVRRGARSRRRHERRRGPNSLNMP